jgi:hypothetical protein
MNLDTTHELFVFFDDRFYFYLFIFIFTRGQSTKPRQHRKYIADSVLSGYFSANTLLTPFADTLENRINTPCPPFYPLLSVVKNSLIRYWQPIPYCHFFSVPWLSFPILNPPQSPKTPSATS